MSFVDELRKLQELYETGALTPKEFSAAKSALVAQNDPGSNSAQRVEQSDLQELRRRIELAVIDNEWLLEREKYYLNWGNGKQAPSRGMGVLLLVLMPIFGAGWVYLTITRPAPLFVTIFGILAAANGMWWGYKLCKRARDLERAESAYRERRRQYLGDVHDKPTSEFA